MALISLNGVGMTTPRPLYQGLTFTFGPGDRVGLVAANGAGKSTLLRCIAGETSPDQGSITLSRGVRVGHVAQELPPSLLPLTMREAVRRALPPALREHEGWRVDVALDEFDTPPALRDQPVQSLSGGWQRLALLARVWVTEPDALLLDEPTNHLDAEKIGLLEAWIMGAAARTPMLLASHDRAFLDATTSRTLFLRPTASRIYAHPYGRARLLLAEDDAAQDRKHAKDQKEVDRLRRNAGELKNIGINSGSDLLQKKSMQLRDRAERLEQALRPAHAERHGDIRLSSSASHAKVAAALRDFTVRAPDGRALVRIGKLDVRQGDRLVLLGRNGVGKSMLAAAFRRAAAQEVLGLQLSPSLVLGATEQGMAHLPDALTPHRLVAARPGVGDAQATSLLAGAGFPIDAQTRPIGRLSPGQRARLGLLALRLQQPSLYVLDEPTNHIDIPGQERLEAELLAQGATVVLVSHDRAFVAAVGTRFLLLEGGTARELDGPP